MKSRIPAAILFAATSIILLSCDWLFKKHVEPATASIVGKWKIDSIADEAENPSDLKGLLALALQQKDSSLNNLEFNTDSSFRVYSTNGAVSDSGKYYVDQAAQKLFIKTDTAYTAFVIRKLTDSLSTFVSADSMVISLRK